MNHRFGTLQRRYAHIRTAPMLGLVVALILPAMTHGSPLFQASATAYAGASCFGNGEVQDIEPLAATASSSQSGTISCLPPYTDDFAAQGSASADLFTGIMRALAIASSSSMTNPGSGLGVAILEDTITVSPSAGTVGYWAENGTIGFTVDGAVDGGATISTYLWLYKSPGSAYMVPGTFQNVACATDPAGDLQDCNFTIQDPFTVSQGSATVSFYMQLNAGATYSGGAYAENTAQAFVTFDDPGYTFTSASGVFLTQQGESVPEPGSLLLIGSGLLGLGVARQRRRRLGRE